MLFTFLFHFIDARTLASHIIIICVNLIAKIGIRSGGAKTTLQWLFVQNFNGFFCANIG